jgi:protein translocase SEC61 complex gamma subunit
MDYRQVWNVTIKPTSDEFKKIVKVVTLGVLIIGGLGFIVTLTKVLLFG